MMTNLGRAESPYEGVVAFGVVPDCGAKRHKSPIRQLMTPVVFGSEVHCARVGGLGAKGFWHAYQYISAPKPRAYLRRVLPTRRHCASNIRAPVSVRRGPNRFASFPAPAWVLESDFEAWLRSRRRPAPGDAASSAEARCPMGLQNEDPPLGSPPVRSTSERPPQGTAPGKRGRPAGAKPISATQVCAKAASSAEAV
jgi:hypothetical protein